MKNPIIIMVTTILSLVLLTGCSQDPTSPPSSSFVDRSMVDYSFIDITSACEIHNDINITYYEDNLSATPCSAGKEETFIYYTIENNWSVMCCEFESKCIEDNVNTTSFNSICEDSNDGKYTGYVFNDDGFWMAQCCNTNGGSCYVDLEINASDESTVCDEDYHKNTYSMDYNGTYWNAMCCIGGIEE
jgi:hypothetical protein